MPLEQLQRPYFTAMSYKPQEHDLVHFYCPNRQDRYGYVVGLAPKDAPFWEVSDVEDGSRWWVELAGMTLVLRGHATDAGAEEYEAIMALQKELNL